MTETHNSFMEAPDEKYILDMEMERPSENGQRDKDAEAQRAKWVDHGIQVKRRNDVAHIVIFDSPDNKGFPVAWRVDNQFGFGPDKSW